MDKYNLAFECFKLATSIYSPSVNNRKEEVANIGKHLYSEIIAMVETPIADTPEVNAAVKRGRKPKPRAE